MFQKAIKHDAKLRMSVQGAAGSGKTYTALSIASHLANGKRVAVVDTEHGSASKYADLFDFDVMEMVAPFHPKNYVEAIKAAAAAGYGVIILDSLTHAWNGEGGMLDIVTEIAKRKYGGNSFAAWNDAGAIQKSLIEAIVSAPIHVIATMRSKMEYALEKDEKTGKTTPKKIGMAPEQRADFSYEFDVVLDMNSENEAIVSKTRCPSLAGRVISKPGKEVADVLVKWLGGESAPAEAKKDVPKPVMPAGKKSAEGEAVTTEGWNADPKTFMDVGSALKWGMDSKVFSHMNHCQNAYDKVKAEKKPETAAAMWALWIQEVNDRVAASKLPQAA